MAITFRASSLQFIVGFGVYPWAPKQLLLGLPYRILNINQKKELLMGLWVVLGFGGLFGHAQGLG